MVTMKNPNKQPHRQSHKAGSAHIVFNRCADPAGKIFVLSVLTLLLLAFAGCQMPSEEALMRYNKNKSDSEKVQETVRSQTIEVWTAPEKKKSR
jgi:hypothetical protein